MAFFGLYHLLSASMFLVEEIIVLHSILTNLFLFYFLLVVLLQGYLKLAMKYNQLKGQLRLWQSCYLSSFSPLWVQSRGWNVYLHACCRDLYGAFLSSTIQPLQGKWSGWLLFLLAVGNHFFVRVGCKKGGLKNGSLV